MPNQKISQLSDGNLAQATDEFLIARSGDNYRVAGTDVAAAATAVGTLTSLGVSGTVAVGTSTPEGGAKMQVVGSTTIGASTVAAQNVLKVFGDGAADKASVLSLFRTGNRECVIAISGGNLLFSNTAGYANYNDTTLQANAQLRLTGTGALHLSSATGTLGYTTGAGAVVTQTGSRTDGVTINSPTGRIVLVSAAGTTAWQSFTVSNNLVTNNDTIIINQRSGTDKYQVFITNVGTGTFEVTFATTGGTTTEQPAFLFSVLRGSNN